jgi:hypothetical protein
VGLKAVANAVLAASASQATQIAAAQRAGVPYILVKAGIPFISLSSGSVAAGGGISGITALPVAYPRAYCYFPANALAAAITAGWYYCTFSTTTAGTAFLDTYTSGMPTIPASPTPVVAGQGAYTGDTGEEFGPTITIPAGAMGANGAVQWQDSITVNNTANAKTCRLRFSGSGGTVVNSQNAISVTGTSSIVEGINNGVATSQTWAHLAGTLAAGSPAVYTAVNTANASSVVKSLQKATATDNIVLEFFTMLLLSTGT